MLSEEIKRTIMDSEDTATDQSPIRELDMNSLDQGSVSRYLMELRIYRPDHPWCRIPTEEFLQLSGAARVADSVLHPSGAGLLMFGKVSCIRQIFGSYFLDYLERNGDERYSYRIHSNSGDWSGNIYDFVCMVMNRISLMTRAPFEINGFSNRGHSDVFIALREAVLNAVIHADHHLSGGVTVQIMPDVGVIRNPGSMRVPLKDAINKGISDPRNNGLMALAMAVGWVERLGSGIPMMYRIKTKGGISSLSITEGTDPSSVTVSIGMGRGTRRRNTSRDEMILKELSRDPRISREELAGMLGISVRTLSDDLNAMKRDGIIERTGGNRHGSWRIIGKR